MLKVSEKETGSSNPEEVEAQTVSETCAAVETDTIQGANVAALGAPATSQKSYRDVLCGVKQ